MATGSNSRGLMLLLLTSGFFIIGLLFDYMPMIVDNQIKRTLELATNEEVKSIWSKPPIDVNSYYWLYTVENADQFMAGEKVRVRRIGPYHFTSRIEKKIIELSQNKYRLIYNSTRHMKLNESAQNPELDELVKFLNPIYASTIEGSREFASSIDDPQMRSVLLSSAARLAEKYNESLFINTTARTQLIGRKVEFIERARKLADTMGFGHQLPETLPGGLFGYVATMNGTWKGPFEIYTGYQASMPSLGDIISYQGRRRMKEFQGRCNRLQASAGELRPMPIGNSQILEMFQPSFCRIVHLQPTGVRKLREGLAISYVLAPEDFLGAESNPDNRCFCVNGTVDNYCSLNGVIELAPCAYYSPIVATTNNMRLDSKITNSIHDWDPELISSDVELVAPADNTSQILILKRLGLPVRADLTIVLFMKVIRDSRFQQTSSVPEVSYIPLLMVREMASIPPQLGQMIVNVESFLALTYHIKVVMYLSALVLLGWLTGHFYNKSTKDRVVPSSGLPPPGGGGSISGSERANSGDSSRSQRPRRVSQSSMDPGIVEMAPSRSIQAAGIQQAAMNRSRQVATPAPPLHLAGRNGGPLAGEALDEDTSRSQEPLAGSPPPAPPQMATSNLAKTRRHQQGDELLLVVTSEAASLAGCGQLAVAGGDVDNQQVKAGAKVEEPRVGEPMSNVQSSGEMLNEAEERPADGLEAQEGQPEGQTNTGRVANRNRKNWFMKVCSNFVRMLNGLRSTINDAGQLDITENNYQDKQLELLAGKIDNWQRYSNDGNESNEEGQATASGQNEAMLGSAIRADGSRTAAAAGSDITITAASSMEPANDGKLKRSGDPERVMKEVGPEPAGVSQQPAAATATTTTTTTTTTASVTVNKDDSAEGGDQKGKRGASGGDAEIDRAEEIASTAGGGLEPVAKIGGEPVPATDGAASVSRSEGELMATSSPAGSASGLVKRSDSGQSNQTIMNKCDTSDDESVCEAGSSAGGGRRASSGEVASVRGGRLDDKASALEQMELALSKKTESFSSSVAAAASEPDDDPDHLWQRTVEPGECPPAKGLAIENSNGFGGPKVGAGQQPHQVEAAGRTKVAPASMINSSTSMDSLLEGYMGSTVQQEALMGEQRQPVAATSTTTSPAAQPLAPNEGQAVVGATGGAASDSEASAHNQSVEQNDQIDESSLAALKQSNKLLANGVAHNDASGGRNSIASQLASAATDAATATRADYEPMVSVEDERRDSGVKLDSRKGPGISDTTTIVSQVNGGSGDTIVAQQRQNNNTKQTTKTAGPTNGENGRYIIVSNYNNKSNNNNNNNNNNLLASSQANRLKQIKGGDTINGTRTKLLNGNGNGNNISNEK